MKREEILQKSISEVSEMLDKKEISSVELTKLVLEQIKIKDKDIKAFITVCEKEALEAAKKADTRLAQGKRLSKIDGVPISLKDNICTAGIRTTAASKMLENFTPAYDATIAKRLKDAGAVIVGKCNMDAWAHGSSTENSDFFTTHNPYDLSRVPGGSSGGSTAAVASGMGFGSVGTETGGSVRQPAGFCSVVGLKPTYGRISRYGLVAMASSLDQAGPVGKTVEDVAIILEAMCGADVKDSTTVPGKKFSASIVQNVKCKVQNNSLKFKIGIPKEYFQKGLDPKVEKAVMDAVKLLEKNGATIKEISLPHTDYALAVYYILQPAEVSSNLARYDGLRYGFSVTKIKNEKEKIKSLEELYLYNRAVGFGDEAKRRIMLGTYVLSSGYYDAYYKKAMKVRTLVCEDFDKAFKDVDVIITPTSPTLPFKIGEKAKDPLSMYLADIYTVSANIAGNCAVSIPIHRAKTRELETGQLEDKKINTEKLVSSDTSFLPIGMQIMGPMWGEEKILEVAQSYEMIKDN